MDAGYRIELLGGVRLLQAGKIVTRFKTTKNGSLLAYLACSRGRPVFREALTEKFWPEIEPDSARNSFRVALNSIRKQLEPPGVPQNSILRSDRLQVSLNPDAFSTDVEDFENALRSEQRSTSDTERLLCLQEAIELYSGDLMAGWYEDWITPERTRLNDMYLGALRRLMRLYAEMHDYDRAVECARRAVVSDPLREEWHRGLMRLYKAQGRPAAAVKQFQDLERLLRDELGIAPSAATRELARQCAAGLTRLPDQDHTLHSPQTDTSESEIKHQSVNPAPKVGGVLPAILTRFFGREREIADITSLLAPESEGSRAPKVRLLTLTGMSGTGKTRLAVEAATRLRPLYSRRIWYVSLEEAVQPHHIANMIAAAMNLQSTPETPALDRILDFLEGSVSLLVLDNFEQLAETGSQIVGELLARSPDLAILVTSQVRLGLAFEMEYPVAPFDAPPEESEIGALLECPLIELFIDRAQAARPDFQLTHRNAQAVATLCARLEGVPLAIELAAAWAQVLTPSQMLDRLSDRFDLLVSTRRGGADRRRTLRKAIDWSYSLLPAPLQEFLAQLSVFSGAWTTEAAAAITENKDAEPYLWQLRQRSLIRSFEAEEEMRFSMMETIRAYLKEQLSPEESAKLNRNHIYYYLSLSANCGGRLTGVDAVDWANRLELDHTNIRTAFTRAQHVGDASNTMRLLDASSALWRFWYSRAHAEEGLNVLTAALAEINQSAIQLSPKSVPHIDQVKAEALLGAARLALSLGRPTEGRAYCLEGLRVAENASLRTQSAHLRATLVLSARDLGNLDVAAETANCASQQAIEDGDRPAAALFCNKAVTLYRATGSNGRAIYHAEQEVRLRRELRDRPGEMEALFVLADLLGESGDLQSISEVRKRASYLESLILVDEQVAASYCELGAVSAAMGDYQEARSLLEDSLVLVKRSRGSMPNTWITESLAWVTLKQADLTTAAAYIKELAGEYSASGDPIGTRCCFRLFSELAASMGRYEDAATFYGVWRPDAFDSAVPDWLQVTHDAIGEDKWKMNFGSGAAKHGAMPQDQILAHAYLLSPRSN